MSKKTKIINIILLFCMICCSFLGFYTVKAEDFYEVNFTVLNTEEVCKVCDKVYTLKNKKDLEEEIIKEKEEKKQNKNGKKSIQSKKKQK